MKWNWSVEKKFFFFCQRHRELNKYIIFNCNIFFLVDKRFAFFSISNSCQRFFIFNFFFLSVVIVVVVIHKTVFLSNFDDKQNKRFLKSSQAATEMNYKPFFFYSFVLVLPSLDIAQQCGFFFISNEKERKFILARTFQLVAQIYFHFAKQKILFFFFKFFIFLAIVLKSNRQQTKSGNDLHTTTIQNEFFFFRFDKHLLFVLTNNNFFLLLFLVRCTLFCLHSTWQF